MRKQACLINNIVVKVQSFSDEECSEQMKNYDMVVDVVDLVITPDIGWILNGNQLVPAPGTEVNLQEMIKSKIKYFQESAPELMRDLYVQNTLLGITTQQSDQMFDDYQDVLLRIREGAWPTAIYRLGQKQPAGFVTQEMINNWSSIIYNKMVST
jgi:hypothetical protein